MSDFTYVENVTHAHVCAAEALDSQMVSVSGKVFLITNLEPVKFRQFISIMLEGLGYQRPFIKLPARLVGYIIMFAKWTHEKLGLRLRNHSLSACYIVKSVPHTKTFDCTTAKKNIVYSPIVSLEILKRTIKSGKVTRWWERLEPYNLAHFFIRAQKSTEEAKTINGIKRFNTTIASLWSMGFWNIRSLAKGDDWNKFFKMHVRNYITFSEFVKRGINVAFYNNLTCEYYESEIDGQAHILINHIQILKELFTKNIPAPVVSFLRNCKI